MAMATRFAHALAVALLTVWMSVPIARADDPEPEVSSAPARSIWDRVLAVEMVGGVDTPWGVFGGAVVVAPIRYLQLDLGGGISRDGGRITGGARLVLSHANGAFGMRLGFSGGPLGWAVQAPDPASPDPLGEPTFVIQRRSWDFVGFIDLALSLEIRLDAGVYGRLLFGVEHALAGADRCVETGAGGSTSACGSGDRAGVVVGGNPTRSYIGLALGYAFEL